VPASLSVTISICSHVPVSSVCCHAPSSAHPSSCLLVLIAPLPVCLHGIPPDHLLVCLPLCQLVASSRQTTFLPPVCCCPPYLFSACHSACLPIILPLDVCLSSCLFCLLVHMPLTNSNILSDCCCPVCLCLPTHACLLPCCSSASQSWHLSACLSFCQLPLICLLLY
jgi:hypothetical protein